MKTNLPITQTERFLEPGKPIVTKTDLKGRITYANESFIRISGFTAEELIGESHNVVRHPDMPTAAFADLWNTVKAHEPWRGLVKNRAKNGDFYWVEAFVTPITENGKSIGYISVRTPPDKSEVHRIEQHYKDVREGRATFKPTARLKSLSVVSKYVWGAIAVLLPLQVGAALLDGLAAWGMLAAGCVGILGVGFWLQKVLVSPLMALQKALAAVDEGQLAKRIEPRGGLLDVLFMQVEAMRLHQRAMFADVLLAAREVANRSQELQQAIEQLEETSGNQTERVMQVAAAMEQMSVSVNEISSNTAQSLEASQATDHAADASRSAMQASTESIQEVVNVVSGSQATIREMHQSIAHIGEFARLIKEIADQTNLLALNAAIEAARAGESGRGFAVVADEVRKLAERTAQTTADITQSVKMVEVRAHDAVDSMEAATAAVGRGTQSISGTAESMEQISRASQSAMELAHDVRRMLQQQSDASHEVAVSMEALASLVDKNHHTVGDIGGAMSRLRGTSGELHTLVKHLESVL
ncbi:MAG: methyl-accepting chemotaxis protein [Rhodocyclaceae bacterium]|nr:methyl-accepting chemotaxis protein [Rhodocyclaceae bacterium]